MRASLPAILLLLSTAAAAQTPPPDTGAPPSYVPPTSYAPPPQVAPAPEPSLVRRYAVGPRFIFAPGVFIPSSGNAGFALGLEGGYGFDLGPVIVTPGLAFQGDWSSSWTVYTGLATVRLTVPLGNFGPFVEGGIGYGHVGGPLGYDSGGLAVRGGAGFLLFLGDRVAFGISGRYDAIIDTAFKGWTIAPILLINF